MSYQRQPLLFLFLTTLFQTEFSTCVTDFNLDNENGTNVSRNTIEVNPIVTLHTRDVPTEGADSPKVAELKKELSDLQRQQNRANRRLKRLNENYQAYLTRVNKEIRQLGQDIKQLIHNNADRAAELKNQREEKREKRAANVQKYKTKRATVTEEMNSRATQMQQKYDQMKEEQNAVKSLKRIHELESVLSKI